MSMTLVDYYSTLGVARTASAIEIDAAYRRAALRWHPDRNVSAEAPDRMAAVNEARDVLRDATRRASYDAALVAARPPRPELNAPSIRWHLRADENPVTIRVSLSNVGGPAARMGVSPAEGSFWEISHFRAVRSGRRLAEFDIAPRTPAGLSHGWHRQTIYAFLDDESVDLLLELEVQPVTSATRRPSN